MGKDLDIGLKIPLYLDRDPWSRGWKTAGSGSPHDENVSLVLLDYSCRHTEYFSIMSSQIFEVSRRNFVRLLSLTGLFSRSWLWGSASPRTPRLKLLSDDQSPTFQSAQPIWPSNRDRDMNITVVFETAIERPHTGPVRLSLAASTLYRLSINRVFRSWGPARGPHGFYRMDHLDITDALKPGNNLITIEVAGYNANSFWTLNQPSFLQAEVLGERGVLASTRGAGTRFTATLGDARLQRVQRYSFQRTFTESYRFEATGSHTWRSAESRKASLDCAVLAPRNLLIRGAPYPDFSILEPLMCVASGKVARSDSPLTILRPRFVANIGPQLLGYKEPELETKPYLEFQQFRNSHLKHAGIRYLRSTLRLLNKYEFDILDFGRNITGFIGLHVKTESPTHLYLTFDEQLKHDDVDFTRLDCANIVEFYLAPGEYDPSTFEPYTLRFLKATVMDGSCTVSGVFLRQYTNSQGRGATFHASDLDLDKLFSAGRETYRQNSVDHFTDCPSRERAGWLCDSFFTSRSSLALTGSTQLEKTFLENFLLPNKFEHIPDGMLPMCYPSDHYDGAYIVNWAMWFVLQLDAYLARSGDHQLVNALKPRVLALSRYLGRFRNPDGLLENLDHLWVDDSEANSRLFLQGINYPTNMLYAEMLDCITRMYGPSTHDVDNANLRSTIRSQSLDGRFFTDNAIRQNGQLVRTQNRSEACQYYAFYFGVAHTEHDMELWSILRDDFKVRGPLVLYPEIARCDIIFGGILRFELLSKAGLKQQLLQECKERLLYMADATGTLWEHDNDRASLNHAFESHITHLLYRDALGVQCINASRKRIQLYFSDNGLEHCHGKIPTPHGLVSVSWHKRQQIIHYTCKTPSGYSVDVSSAAGLEHSRSPA